MPLDESGSCGTCAYARAVLGPDKTLKLGCHYFPPVNVVVQYRPDGASWQSHFPLVDKSWICGKYELKSAIIKQ